MGLQSDCGACSEPERGIHAASLLRLLLATAGPSRTDETGQNLPSISTSKLLVVGEVTDSRAMLFGVNEVVLCRGKTKPSPSRTLDNSKSPLENPTNHTLLA